jgi:hypothetical protein
MSQEMNGSTASGKTPSGVATRILNVFFNPQTTFLAVKEAPKWIIPAVIFVVVMGVFGYLQTSDPGLVQASNELVMQKLEERNMPQEQMDAALAMTEKMRAFTPIQTAIMPLIALVFIGSGIWLFVANTLLGSRTTYGQLLGVTSYTSLITALGTLVKLPIMLAKSDLMVHFSLATFMADSAKSTFLYKFLMSATDLFAIWTMAVLSIGLATVAGVKVNKVWPAVVIVSVLSSVLFALMM